MLTIPQALARLKGNFADAVPQTLIRQICRDLEYPFRQRSLTPIVTTYLFLQQVLHGNSPVGALRHISGLDFTDSAYCQARARLPLAFFRRLQRAVTGTCRHDDTPDPAGRWHGHRLVLIDGSSFSMPDTPELQEAFGQPGGQASGCGFPTAHLLVLFDAPTGFLRHALPAPLRTHDLSQAAAMHRALEPGDLLLGDRAFCSYAQAARPVPGPPEVAHRLPPAPPPRPPQAGREGAGRVAPVALAEAPGQARPVGRVLQAEGPAGVDDRSGVRLPAGVAGGARGALPGA
jgi:hypothetical protein